MVLRRNVFIRWGICLRGLVPLLRSSIYFLSVCTQGFISGFALIPPWAMQECRAYGTRYHRVHALTEVFTRTYGNECDALTKVSTSHLLSTPDGLQKDKFHLFFCGALQNGVIARH